VFAESYVSVIEISLKTLSIYVCSTTCLDTWFLHTLVQYNLCPFTERKLQMCPDLSRMGL